MNPNVGDVRGLYWTGDAFYDALEVEVKKKFGSRLNIQGSYTWGKAIDTGSATVIGDPFQTSISSPYFFCKSCRRGLSDFNIAQSFSAHVLWNVLSPKNLGVIGSQALGGWQLGSIITAQTGVPFTPIITGDVLGLGSADPWAFQSLVPGCNPINGNFKTGAGPSYYNQQCFTFPQQRSIPDALCNHTSDANGNHLPFCLNEFGNVGRNSLVGPKLVDVDFSVYKNFPIRKNLKLTFSSGRNCSTSSTTRILRRPSTTWQFFRPTAVLTLLVILLFWVRRFRPRVRSIERPPHHGKFSLG